MDYKLILNKCKESIINDIRGDIYELFKTRHFISEDQFDLINNEPQIPTKMRNEKFFEILLRIVDQNVFEQFLLMLEENYWWIAKDLRHEAVINGSRRVIEEDNLPTDSFHRQMAKREESEKVLRRGGTPLHQLSKLCVSRWDMVKKLNQEIRNLKPGLFLVLHGMCGSGKSSLAMEVLKDYELVFDHLEGNVFWLSELRTIEQIHLKLLGLISDGAHFHGEVEPINCQTQISHIIKQKKLENALIVFDDVVSSDLIQYLNFNCKKLIITHDENIVFRDPSNEVSRLRIDNFLTEKEALTLLATASGITWSNLPGEAKEIIRLTQEKEPLTQLATASGTNWSILPGEAKEIFRLTKGFPFLLHFIARQIQQNKEASKNGLWKKYTAILNRERRGKEVGPINSSLNTLYNVLNNQLEELATEKQHYYELFSVFPSDVNLHTEVFTTIWSMNEISAMNLLDEFENKSLIGKRPNTYIKGYVYGIHDVLLYYLRNRKKDSMKDLHNELIDKYNAKCGGEFWNLQGDNYIHVYLGYHLEKAGRLDLFNLFVNLLFVSAKIKAAGANDLLDDYEKYAHYIATKDNEELFEELKEFVRHYGHILHQSDDINIIQLGLQQKESSAIFKSAKAFAQKQPDKLFLNFQPKRRIVDSNSDSLSFKIQKDVNAACFSDQFNYAFLANSDGSINKKKLDRANFLRNSLLTGHETSVVHLTLSPDKRYLLSVSKDLEFRVWDLLRVNNDQRFNYNGTLKDGDQSPSPPLRQQDHSPIFGNGLLNMKCDYLVKGTQTHTRPLTCVKFSPDSKYILSCSDDNCVIMWNFERDVILGDLFLRETLRKNTPSVPRCCAFSLDGRSVVMGCDNKTLFAMPVEQGFKTNTFKFDSAIKCLHAVMGVNGTHPSIEGHSDFVLVLSNKVTVIRIKGPVHSTDQNYEVLCSWTFQKSQESFITRSWVPENGAFIALTTSGHCVSLYNLANGHLQREYTYESSQEVMGIDLFMDGNTSYMLVLCQNETLHMEKLELSPNEQASKFCAAPNWGDEEPTIVVPCISGFKVIKGEHHTPFDLKTHVTSCHIDSNATLVVIGTDCGTVLLFDLDTDGKKTILEFKDCNRNPSLVVLVRVFMVENETVIVGIDSKHLVKISYKADVMEYQARSEVKGIWYSSDLNELILVGLNQEIEVCEISNCLDTFYDWSQNNENDDDNVLEGTEIVQCCDMSSTNHLAIATSKSVTMLNLADRNITKIVFNQSVNCCGFSPDGLNIAFGFADGTIQVYSVQLQLVRETNVKSTVKSVCIGNGAKVFGALSPKRIYLGCLYNDTYRIGCTELAAKQLIKAANNDCFLTIDKLSQIYKVTFFNSFDFSEAFSTLDINPPRSSRPRLITKRKLHLYE